MATIEVEKTGENTCRVTVTASSVTTHTVAVPENYYKKLTGGTVSLERLVEASFEFLLERESNTMILSSFDLPVINQYFPEYEKVIGNHL